MKITKTYLKKIEACEEGIKCFSEMFPKGFNLKDWTYEKQIEVIKSPLREFIGWGFRNKIIPMYSMNDANLYNADLSYADLYNADLRYANLLNADLRYADLSNADLSYANLRNANLSNADLRYADLRYADLRYANLLNADLRYADLSNANLSNADLSNANLRNAIIDNKWKEKINNTNCYNKESIRWV
jgi:uncharacterized protein YjbI with pentapeptide repeats